MISVVIYENFVKVDLWSGKYPKPSFFYKKYKNLSGLFHKNNGSKGVVVVMNDNRGNIEIDVKQLFENLVRRAWLILLVGALLGALAFGYAAFAIKPMYASSVQMYVNNTYGPDTSGFSSSQLQAAQRLAATYMVILDSRDVLADIAKESGLGYSASQLRGMIKASAVNETEIFRVQVVCENYIHAAQIARAVAKVLPERIAYYVEGSSVVVVEHAVENPNPISPNVKNYTMMGVLVGCAGTMLIILAVSLMDTTIKSEEYLTQTYEAWPLLAVIPDAENPKGGSGYRGYYETHSKTPPLDMKGGAK